MIYALPVTVKNTDFAVWKTDDSDNRREIEANKNRGIVHITTGGRGGGVSAEL